jgi:hypothetical protein
MTKQELIDTLEDCKNVAIDLRDNGERNNGGDDDMDWGSLICIINDIFKFAEINDR